MSLALSLCHYLFFLDPNQSGSSSLGQQFEGVHGSIVFYMGLQILIPIFKQ